MQEHILHPQPGTVIRLDGDAVWLGMPLFTSADLFLRPCYPELFQAREAYIEKKQYQKGCISVFTGTPGVFQEAWGCTHLGACLHYWISQRKTHVQVSARVIWRPCL